MTRLQYEQHRALHIAHAMPDRLNAFMIRLGDRLAPSWVYWQAFRPQTQTATATAEAASLHPLHRGQPVVALFGRYA